MQSSGDRRHQQNFIAFLKRVGRPAQKADVFFVHIDVQEAANLALVITQVRLEFGKLLVEYREQFAQVGSCARDRSNTIRMTPQRGWDLHRDRHGYAPTAASWAAAITPGTSSRSSVCCRYASNSVSFGAIGRSVLYTPASTSVSSN